MNHEEELQQSLLDIFAQGQETLDEAKKKNQSESSNRAQFLRLSKDGIYNVRILPLAPVIDAQGNVLPLERKGYEYPIKEYMLKIKTGKFDKKNQEIIQFVNICNARLVFPDLDNDLLDLYVQVACNLYADNEKLCKTLRGSSYNGGLRYDSKRCMYVLDVDNRADGMKILQLSFAQYKELESRKLSLWAKLAKRGAVPCPISSPLNAYPVEIERKNDNGKTSYVFNIDTVADKDELSDAELQDLLNAPRLPEALYKYTRFHLEATIAFLKQMDERYQIDVMKEDDIQDCIDQIKLKLPSDDQSHFVIKGEETDDEGNNAITLNDLYKIYDALEEEGKSDRSEEGADLRGQICDFIEAQDLGIKVSRTKSNLDLLEEIDKLMGGEDEKPAPASKKSAKQEESDDEENDAPATELPEYDLEEDLEEDEGSESHHSRRERNDDTNEPAARPRRVTRPARRRQ